MRMAIFGAGAVGAYVGGRVVQAGVPVAFLARGDHLHALARDGLRVDSPHGDFWSNLGWSQMTQPRSALWMWSWSA
jgi:2-dehydropantoate 2-reductase